MKTLFWEGRVEIAGLGLIVYSPYAVAQIARGENFLRSHFMDGASVQSFIQAGSLVGFGTGSSGTFRLRFFLGTPDEAELDGADYTLRLGIVVRGGQVCVRDLYDLIEWNPECPAGQRVAVEDGTYRLTLMSDLPESEVLGDDQLISFVFEPVTEFPKLAKSGIPTLIPD